mmetsp:Transcript_62493/g.171644  ORF Transcript_62493/g.171644 Transcript_62493/m.171644 type:complete len:82 (-) Transcript_62493:1082-1327(-)
MPPTDPVNPKIQSYCLYMYGVHSTLKKDALVGSLSYLSGNMGRCSDCLERAAAHGCFGSDDVLQRFKILVYQPVGCERNLW